MVSSISKGKQPTSYLFKKYIHRAGHTVVVLEVLSLVPTAAPRASPSTSVTSNNNSDPNNPNNPYQPGEVDKSLSLNTSTTAKPKASNMSESPALGSKNDDEKLSNNPNNPKNSSITATAPSHLVSFLIPVERVCYPSHLPSYKGNNCFYFPIFLSYYIDNNL